MSQGTLEDLINNIEEPNFSYSNNINFVFFDNVNFGSNSGPNGFAHKLGRQFGKRNITSGIPQQNPNIPGPVLGFVHFTPYVLDSEIYSPKVLRLDGIWFNTRQDYDNLNKPIKNSYEKADKVIVQSQFDKDLIEKFFGKRDNIEIIRNGTSLDDISRIGKLQDPNIDNNFEKVWLCASHWRPHKRLKENIRYFIEHSENKDCLLIAGKDPDTDIDLDDFNRNRIFYIGELTWTHLIGVMKRADYFLHLSWLDHCPNVVIDAMACDCHIICSSQGGTKEIVRKDSTIIEEDEWNFEPCDLYDPPKMDFSKKTTIEDFGLTEVHNFDILNISESYLSLLK